MSTFIFALFSASLTMSIVILLLLLLNKVLANKVPAVFRYYMWLIILFGLLIPFRPSISVPFQPVQIPIPISLEAAEISDQSMQNEALQLLPPESAIAPGTSSVSQTAQRPPVSLLHISLGIWLVGMLTILAFHLRSYRKFTASVQRWGVDITDTQTLSVFQTVWRSMELSGTSIAIKQCVFLSGPMLIGYRQPKILLPEKAIPSDELEHIFRHELTHYKRRDLWMNLLVLLVSAIHWFNPFVYLMAKTIRADCEVACDEAAVAGKDTEKRKHYGETIIGFIGAKRAMTPVLSTYFYGGNNSMKKRLFSIMDTSQKRKSLAALCAISLLLTTLLLGNVFAAGAAANNNEQYIGEAKAKSIALAHAGLSESQVTFIKAHLERDDGRIVYDVEFYSGNTEYDYEIDAVSGIILEYDRDIEHYSIPSHTTHHAAATPQPAPQTTPQPTPQAMPGSTEQYIGEAKAKSIALSAAGLSESQVSRMSVKLDREDGVMVYEVEFNNGRTEYEYEIDANSGKILKTDVDYDD